MPNEVQNGLAVIYGIGNNGTAITMSGYASFILETAKAQHKFKLEAVEDELGFDRALIATNANTEIDIAWTPAGATRTDAANTAVLIEPLALVTLSNFAVDAFNGDWMYIGDGSIDLSHKQGKMMLKLRRYADADQNTSLTTTVSG